MTNNQDKHKPDNTSPEVEFRSAQTSRSAAGFYEIQVKSHLHLGWSDWLGGLEMKLLDNGEMILFGQVLDQAALMGILNILNRLNLALLSVNEVKKIEMRKR